MRWPWSKKSVSVSEIESAKASEAVSASIPESDPPRSAEPKIDSAPTAPTPPAKEAPIMSEANTPEPEASEAKGDSAPGDLEKRIVESLKTVYDPEIPVDIYELGLIYEVDVREANSVYVKMTLTSPMCPVAETLPPEVEEKVRMVEGVSEVQLELVWDPPWDPSMMSEAAKLELNM